MNRLLHPLLALMGTATALFAACYVNGPAKECPGTVFHSGGTCNYVGGIIPWTSPAPPGVSGRTQACPLPKQCVYNCPHLGGEQVKYYTGAVVSDCGNPCVGEGVGC